ncbi:hypothetical protein RJ639_022509 [Escallonia herrerae]|uniref:Tropinone reductase-like 1 n=1 Tax=Escallonia herrerae TaxID=1293975 RepID=A0AA88V631_9ASTE|nr:hypothetical protein RJ639_022509 [Escallonia herrerae]
MGDVSNVAASNKRLNGKVAIVTGGASGIGESTVHLFAENGAKVVIADIQDEVGQKIADKLGENVCYIHCDVSDEDDVIRLIDTAVSKYGHLDIMYNNAGIVDSPIANILHTIKSDLERVLGVNLVGSLLGAKHAARVMVPRRQGCILFTASACASIAGVASHPYTVSKHGIVGLAKNLAAELGQYGIRVNCVSPTGMVSGSNFGVPAEVVEASSHETANLKGKILRVKDVAMAALYLASDEASYVSGHNLVVDGGYSVVNPTMMKAAGLIP